LTYPDLPITGATHKRNKITLPKAVVKENNRGSIALVQKAGRISERIKKRVAEEQACENGAREGGESGDQVEGRALKRARVAIGAPRRSGRHV
jgi:hypothetical protein